MNALTKTFVVLLVVCSLLLSAAVVVFVNRVENYQESYKKITSDRDSARSTSNNLQARIAEMDTVSRNEATAASAREGALNGKITDLQKQLLDAQGQLAQAKNDLQMREGTVNGLTATAKAAQEENKGLQTLLTDVRTKNDDLLRQNGELNIAVTTKDNEGRALNQQLRFAQERIAELTTQAKNAPKAGGSSEANPTPSAPIAGHVTSVDIIGGKKYATISVGSADNVQKGMKFNVVNSNAGEFLGFLTVDRVEANEAIGIVEGSKINKIEKGADVRTQL